MGYLLGGGRQAINEDIMCLMESRAFYFKVYYTVKSSFSLLINKTGNKEATCSLFNTSWD